MAASNKVLTHRYVKLINGNGLSKRDLFVQVLSLYYRIIPHIQSRLRKVVCFVPQKSMLENRG